jgi:hypothetical protein
MIGWMVKKIRLKNVKIASCIKFEIIEFVLCFEKN